VDVFDPPFHFASGHAAAIASDLDPTETTLINEAEASWIDLI